MSPAVNSALALLALGFAVLAIVLATIANRRWARRPVRAGGPRQPRAEEQDQQSAEPSRLSALDAEGASTAVGADRAERDVLASVLATLRKQVEDLRTHVDDLGAQSATVRSEVEALRNNVDVLAERADGSVDPTALRNVAMVRYDAFADVGGRLSYSVALLDDTGSGLVLTTLAGKADVRTYVRTISAGTPDGSLTAEEQQAIDAAVGSRQ